MDADQALGRLAAHRVGDARAHVAALGHVARVAETAHELGPGPRGSAQVPADLGRLGGEAVPGQGREHEVEGVLGAAAVRRRIRERADGVEHLDHGAGPAVGHDQRQGVLVLRAHVDEVDVHAVDLGDELREGIEPLLDPPEVVLVLPVARQRLRRRELDALRAVGGKLLARPAGRGEASSEVVDRLPGKLDVEWPDRRSGLDSDAHEDLPRSSSDPASRPYASNSGRASRETGSLPALSGGVSPTELFAAREASLLVRFHR